MTTRNHIQETTRTGREVKPLPVILWVALVVLAAGGLSATTLIALVGWIDHAAWWWLPVPLYVALLAFSITYLRTASGSAAATVTRRAAPYVALTMLGLLFVVPLAIAGFLIWLWTHVQF